MPLTLRPLPADRYDEWREATRTRLIRLRQESGMRLGQDAVDQADAYFTDLLPDGLDTATSRILRIVDDVDGEIGTVWLGLSSTKLFIVDLAFTGAPTDVQDDALIDAVLAVAREHGLAQVSIALYPQDAAGHRFVEDRGFEISSIQMMLEPLPDRQVAAHVEVSPMTPERYSRYAVESEAAFAQDLVDAGRYTMEEAVQESRRQFLDELPQGLDTPGQSLFTASFDDVEVGILWIGMRRRDGRPHAFILDIEVAAEHRRKGYGRELMHAAEREAQRLGAGSIGLHVFGFNTGAVSLYHQLGYRRLEEHLLLEL